MAKKRGQVEKLGARERQILDVVFRLESASVADVKAALPDAPSYSSVRTMMGVLETKGFLRRHRDGVRHLYSATQSRDRAGRSALAHLMSTFFDGSASRTFAALLEESASQLDDDELQRLQQEIDRARAEGR